MPLELINMVKGFLPPTEDDRGFLFHLARQRQSRWNNSATTEAMNLLRTFAEPYYKMKCPEEYSDVQSEDSQGVSDSQDKTSTNSTGAASTKKSYCIQFACRDMAFSNIFCFVACNLADPADFAHYVVSKMAEGQDAVSFKQPDPPFHILPMQRLCEASPGAIEETLQPLFEQTLANDSQHPHRFSLNFLGHHGKSPVSPAESTRLARNCVWAANPNCVQCVKYQDFAIVMECLDNLFYVGVLRDFQRLQGYNTSLIAESGLDRKESGTDSEDDISDDLTLDEAQDRKRKIRIKRKRRSDKLKEQEKEEEEEEGGGRKKVKVDGNDNGEGGEDCDDDGGEDCDGDKGKEQDEDCNGSWK